MLIRVWDGWTRSFHWCFAAAVIFLLFSGETGFLFFEWHKQIGEFVLLLLLFRVLWGTFGSSNARLFSLVSNPKHALSHLAKLIRGKVYQERGHNAAGGWAVLLMLLLVGFQAVSGLFIADEDELIEGTFYGLLGSDITDQLLQLHHLNAKFLMALVGTHIFMVFFYLLRAKQNLIKPMITGRMSWTQSGSAPPVNWVPFPVGLVLFFVCLGVVGWGLGWFRF